MEWEPPPGRPGGVRYAPLIVVGLVVGIVGGIGLSTLLVGGPALGIALAALLLVALVVFAIRRAPRDTIERARVDDSRHRVLLLADETLERPGVERELLARTPNAEVRIVAPMVATRIKQIASDTDAATREARRRIDRLVAVLGEHDVRATGTVGDADPVQAVADALRTFPATEVIVSTFDPSRSRWVRTGAIDRLRAQLDVPVTHLTPQDGDESVTPSQPPARRRSGERGRR